MTEIRVPTLGESVTEATIGRWFKKAGDAVAVDEPLVELETDKVTIEVPAPAAGVLAEIAAKDGETVAVGALLGQINEGAAARRQAGRCAVAGQGRDPRRPRAATRCRARRNRRPRCAAGAFGSQDRGRERHRSRGRAGHRQGRTRDQGRHAGRDRACGVRADAGRSAGRLRAGPRTVARRRCRARRARADDAAAPDHRAPAQGRAEHGRHAHDLQRGRHDARHGAAQAIQGAVREEVRHQARLHGLLRAAPACRR